MSVPGHVYVAMNKHVETSNLEIEARRMLRYRLPLALAVLINAALLARVPLLQMRADGPSAAASMIVTADAGHGRLTAPPLPPARHRTVQLIAAETPEPASPDPPAGPPGADHGVGAGELRQTGQERAGVQR